MAISDLGRQYICSKFGDVANLCCINTGLSWYFTRQGTNYNESGGTAQIVSRLASGLVESLTMTNPARGTFTQAELNAANGSVVTLLDAQEITLHDESTEDQWCFIVCEAHADEPTCLANSCYWYNGTCHTLPPACEIISQQWECEAYGCYWYNGSCHTNPPACEIISTQPECEIYGCYWYNGACHTSSPDCAVLNNQSDCEIYGCFWYNGSCHPSVICEEINNQVECEEVYSCYWYNGACHSNPPACTALNNEPDCSRYACFWYRGVCHPVDQPELCYWIDSKGGIAGLTITTVFEAIDSFLFGSPPAGWTFIPTITEIFGIIDYFLGFDGDAATGCTHFGG